MASSGAAKKDVGDGVGDGEAGAAFEPEEFADGVDLKKDVPLRGSWRPACGGRAVPPARRPPRGMKEEFPTDGASTRAGSLSF